MSTAPFQIGILSLALWVGLIGIQGSVHAETLPAEAETPEAVPEVSVSRLRLTTERLLEECERYLPVCQPALAYRSMDGRFYNLRNLPMLRPIPSVALDPRLARSMTALATGLMLKTARGVAMDPFSIDPIRYFSPAQRDMVGIHTPADQLGELAHPVIGSNCFRPTPKAGEESAQ